MRFLRDVLSLAAFFHFLGLFVGEGRVERVHIGPAELVHPVLGRAEALHADEDSLAEDAHARGLRSHVKIVDIQDSRVTVLNVYANHLHPNGI